MQTTRSCHIRITGMYCVQCERKIAKALKAADGISNVKVSYRNSDTSFMYDSSKVTYDEIAGIIRAEGYDIGDEITDRFPVKAVISLTAIAVLFIILQHFGLLNMLAPSQLAESGMGYPTLFGIGLITSVHCIAMCGGINLSQSLPNGRTSYSSTVLYNAGRVISYTITGVILGTVGYFLGGGSQIGIPLLSQGIFKIAAGVILVIMGVQMLGIFPWLQKLSIRLPKALVRKAGKTAAKSKTPLIVGLLNGIVPCGPLQAMWLVALASGSPVRGGVSMLLFSLGTVPLMMGFGAFVTTLGKKFTETVQTIGAVVVVVMGLAMLSQGSILSGMIPDNILYAILIGAAITAVCFAVPVKRKSVRCLSVILASGIAAGSGFMFSFISARSSSEDIARDVGGIQIVESTLKPGSYPEITVQTGIPVKWCINADDGSINGCNNSIVCADFNFECDFHEGENIIEFTPEPSGDYSYSCWMGMIHGTIHVVDKI